MMADRVPDNFDPTSFLDVDLLLDASHPRQRGSIFWYFAVLVLLLILLSSYTRWQGQGNPIIETASALAIAALVLASMGWTWFAARAVQREQSEMEAAAELIQLRRWPEAAMLVQNILTRPARSPSARVQALIYLGSVLARYHRFADAVIVYEHLLDHDIDPDTAHGLRLGRAMALLREDRLFDADRAIAELRRDGDERSGGLGLIEIYRDVKTGHPNEALETFGRMHVLMKKQLGHRIGDAWGLAARAHDLLNQPEAAQRSWENATALIPPMELVRRYPELAGMSEKYGAFNYPEAA